MKEFTLLKNGGTAVIDILHDSDLSDVMKLHEAARAVLTFDTMRFLLPQGTAYFQNLLTRMTGLMVGVRVDGKLVAQIALAGPMPLREAIALHAITQSDISFHHASLDDSVVIFENLASLPGLQNDNLEMNLVGYAITLPFVQVCDHAFAQFSVSDKRKWEAFAHQKFGIIAATYDPQDKLPRFIFQKPSFGFDFAPEVIADEVDPVADFSAIVSLTQREALVGVYENESAAKLSFLRNREEINLMPVLARVSTQK